MRVQTVLTGVICWGISSEPSAVFQKITTKNAFGLHLIDYMTEILKEKESELTNFKVRGIAAGSWWCFVSDWHLA